VAENEYPDTRFYQSGIGYVLNEDISHFLMGEPDEKSVE
jgi:hypothetical protein